MKFVFFQFNISQWTVILFIALGTVPHWALGAAVPDLEIKSKGRPPSSQLKIKKSSLVPTYELHKSLGKPVPRLDVGEESELGFTVVPLPFSPPPQTQSVPRTRLPSPKAIEFSFKSIQPSLAKTPILLVSEKSLKQIPEVRTLKEIPDPQLQTPEPKPKTLTDFKAQDFKLLEGLIFLEARKNNDMALAYFAELLEDKDLGLEARFHYARAAKERGLNTEVRASLLKIAQASKNKDWKVLATEALVENIGLFDISDLKEIDPFVQALDIDVSKSDTYNFYRAKYYLEQGNLGQVEEALVLIPEKSKYFADGLLISALSSYRQGKLEAAQLPLIELLKKTTKEETIRSVGAMTLARLQFQKGQYKDAYQTYLEVDKSHALWLQAMVEQAWAQILNHDYEGAAGNMFSLHTDFFKNAYNPESYVVRTVGYLNLCQFGDSVQALNNMGKRYGPTFGRLQTYLENKKNPPLYETVRRLLKNPELREVDGLPRSFIIELARHPSFINAQKHLNGFEDEINTFNQVTVNLIQREKDLLKQQSEANRLLSENRMAQHEAKIDPEKLKTLLTQESSLQKKLFAIKFEYQNVNHARAQVKETREKSILRIESEKQNLRKEISRLLQLRFDDLAKSLKALLDQTEVLNYEIYSGAGEQLRYQAAGGEGSLKERPQLKPEKDKSTTWSFKGEIWEDEIGHFRSSLKSVCPPEEGQVSKNGN